MIKLSLSPDLRFANDKLVNRKATVTLGDNKTFNGTFSIMPASASTQAAITAEASVLDSGWIIESEVLADPKQNKVELKANVIKTVHFNKGQTKVDTGLVFKQEEALPTSVDSRYTLSKKDHGNRLTLAIERTDGTEAETADVELEDVTVATGSLVGNTMGFKIKGGDPVRMHALCNWVGHVGLKENLESFKVVTKDHDAIVLSLETHSDSPKMPGATVSES